MLFCVLLAIMCGLIPAGRFIDSAQAGTEYSPMSNIAEIAAMLLFIVYFLVLLFNAIKSGVLYIRGLQIGLPGAAFLKSALIAMFCAVELLAVSAIPIQGAVQSAALFEVDLGELICVWNDALANTNYALTPDKPAHCF